MSDVRKVAAWLPVSHEMVADVAGLGSSLDELVDRVFRPWRYPDRPFAFEVVLFPRVERLAAWIRSRFRR